MKKLKFLAVIGLVLASLLPVAALAGASIAPSGGGSVTAGSTISVKIVAAGATFNAFSGTIGVSGNLSVTGVSYDTSLIWIGTPGANKTFNGALAGNKTVLSLTIATLTVKGTAQGSGKITVSNALLSNESSIPASGGTLNVTVNRAPTVPGAVTVTSSTNPDQNQAYGVTTATFSWTAPTNGATGYAVAFDQVADTNPAETVTTTALTASYPNLNLGVYYFHIKGHNNDGWGPVTHFKITTTAAVDAGLKAPKITTVKKLASFKTNLTAGTLGGFSIGGSSTGLTDFTVILTLTPAAAIPAEQKLTSPIAADGSWSVIFDQPIPTGFYKVTALATKDKTATAPSTVANVELSVASGGTAKIITAADAPKPDVSVKVAGATFKNPAAYHKFIGFLTLVILAFAALVTFAAYFGRQWYKRWRARSA
ncbi:MAG TPA: fibronectin type III domain-containing protein [Candidatus Saccharimonadales bacterium]|nr:fibronectin type III domain-containing protein [Candidatus Saccharimonadales bacterium]